MSGWLSATLVAGALGALAWLESRRPLRRRALESKLRRDARNLAVAVTAAAAVRLAERPVVGPLTSLAERRRWGLLNVLKLPRPLKLVLAVALLDYTLYLWHVLTHRVPALWRFHLVHHADLDMDATTALRFHFGEILLSVAWRAAQIRCLGVSPPALRAWQTLLFASIIFHHSNVRLPKAWERRLCLVVVTPRQHAVHHTAARELTNSNWSSGLTLWDRLHGTLRPDASPDERDIGVPAYREPAEVGLREILLLPFVEQRPAWRPAPIAEAAAHVEQPRQASRECLSA